LILSFFKKSNLSFNLLMFFPSHNLPQNTARDKLVFLFSV
jgi:hypothetical protein